MERCISFVQRSTCTFSYTSYNSDTLIHHQLGLGVNLLSWKFWYFCYCVFVKETFTEVLCCISNKVLQCVVSSQSISMFKVWSVTSSTPLLQQCPACNHNHWASLLYSDAAPSAAPFFFLHSPLCLSASLLLMRMPRYFYSTTWRFCSNKKEKKKKNKL